MTAFGRNKQDFARRDPAVTRLLHCGLSRSRPWNGTLGYIWFEKELDSVDRKVFWKILWHNEIPEKKP